jgi:squalene-associated FAD-dependent desaturase
MRAVVIGGGLAGLAAALELVDAGHEVTVLESRPTLGGAVQTLPAREGDPEPPPDNGQHIGLGCFESYLRFLARIGSGDAVRRIPLQLPVIDERGRRSAIGDGFVSLLRYRHLPLTSRLGVVRALMRMRNLDPAAESGRTFGDLLRSLGQAQRSIDRFWDVFVRPALNLRTDEASASIGLVTVQEALLGPKGSGDLLLPTRPLGEMHGAAAGRALRAAGADVRTQARVTALEEDAALVADGERVEADAFVVAVPPAESARLLGEDEPGLADSPIVSAHLLFDRRLLDGPLAAMLGGAAHWIFDRGRLTGSRPARGQYLTVVSSGAPELLGVRGKELVELFARELTTRLGRAELEWSRVSREPAATFAPRPGVEALRPLPETGRPNVIRAGAWVGGTNWPATMETAVRSGVRAASMLSDVATKVPV